MLILISTFCNPLRGQFSLQGTVQDAETGENLSGAVIALGNEVSMSLLDGKFALRAAAGPAHLSCSYLGYQSAEIDLTIQSDTTIVIRMQSSNQILQTATVSAGRYEKALGETTVSLEVLPSALIQNVNGNQVDEVLDKVPGVTIIDGQANIRGGSGFSYGAGSRVLLLVDDIPALQADAGYPNWNDLAVETIGQIEVVKGAASALYGSAAMNGVINVRSDYARNKPETKISTFYTHYQKPRDQSQAWWGDGPSPYATGASAVHKHKWQKLDLVASAFYYKQNSYNEGTTENYGRGTANLRYRFSERFSLGLNMNVTAGKSSSFFYWLDDSTGIFRGTESTAMSSEKLRYFVDPSLTYIDRSNNRHKVLGRLYRVDNQVTNGRSNHSSLFYGEYQFHRHFNSGLDLTAGLVGSGTAIEAELYGDTSHQSRNLAGYVQADQKLWNRLNIALGLRYEYNALHGPEQVAGVIIPGGKTTESKPVFRLGLNYQAADFTYLRASFGQGYRYPTIAEKFITTSLGPTFVGPNPELQSETGWSAELGIKQGLGLGEWQGFIDVSGFWMEYRDMMEFVFIGLQGFQSQNIGNTRIKGLDVSLVGRGRLAGLPLSVLAGYTYIDPRFRNFNQEDSLRGSCGCDILKYRSRHSFKIDLQSDFGKFSAGTAVFYNSHMVSIDKIFEFFIPGVANFRKEHAKGFATWDLRLSYQLLPPLKCSLIARNVLNSLVANRPGLMDAPRNISLRVDYSF